MQKKARRAIYCIFLCISSLLYVYADFYYDYNQNDDILYCYDDTFAPKNEYILNVKTYNTTYTSYSTPTRTSRSGKYRFYEAKSSDGKECIGVLDTKTQKNIAVIQHEWHYLYISPDETVIAVGNDGGGSYGGYDFYRLPSGEKIGYKSVAYFAYIGERNDLLMQLDINSKDYKIQNLEGTGPALNITSAKEGSLVLSANNKVAALGPQIYDTGSWKERAKLDYIDMYSCFSNNDLWIYVPLKTGIACYNTKTGEKSYQLAHTDTPSYGHNGIQLFYTKDDKLISCGIKSGIVKIWNTKNRTLLKTITITESVSANSVSANTVATSSANTAGSTSGSVQNSSTSASAQSQNVMNGKKALENNDYDSAFQYFLKASILGEAEGQYYLGELYFYGQGVERDYDMAFSLYQKAALQNYPTAQNDLGYCYKNGVGTKQDIQKAVEWYTKAYNNGSIYAAYNLAELYRKGEGVPKDINKAFSYMKIASDAGLAVAQYNLGDFYFYGQGTAQDYSKAVELYRKAAEQDYTVAYNDLGYMYLNGYGVTKNETIAFAMIYTAAEKGMATAQHSIGYMYENGIGTKQSYKDALEWYTKAFAQGNEGSEEAIKRVKEKM